MTYITSPSSFKLQPHDAHIWSTTFAIPLDAEEEWTALLSQDELERAKRFRFLTHQQRFIAARATLRRILSLYLACSPQHIRFAYSEHNKPYLCMPDTALQFNISHSDDMAAYAFTLHHAIGIDIEKIQASYEERIATRYFSQQENIALTQLSAEEKSTGFYRLWSRKEAIIKAVGKGLAMPMASFSVAAKDVMETISLEDQVWSLIPLSLHADFKSAFATSQVVKHIYLWDFFNREPRLNKVYSP